jgi:general secretion pathway protein E
VTGPTGSGKTSTLYAALNTINGDEKNIVTIEDPVEYRLQGINQVNVDPNIELGFASGLRAILRQDPDVIMVGEVRDMETAKIAMRAALTGHLVFSTLHTNTAVGAIATLGQMGIEPYMVVSAISGVISQRLVRALCQECKKAFTPKSDVLANLKITGSTRKRMFRAVGCPACLQTGYHGRTGLFELMPMNEKIGGAILSRQSEGDIVARAREAGCASLLDNAIRKLYEGITSPEEIVETVFIEE